MLKIGKIELHQPILLAPMEDVTDVSYRLLCKELGADIVYTEFINSDGLIRKCKQAKKKLTILEEERPIGIQIYGHNIDSMVQAAIIAEDVNPDFIDINAGCWVKKVSRRGAGSGLLREPDHFFKLVNAVVNAVSLPVTVKTRIGWDADSINILDIAKRVEDAGAVVLTVHCRTRAQGHTGISDWSWINQIKKVISIPVVLNGGVMNAEDVKKVYETTNADGVMIARGAIGCPWVFQEAKEIMKFGNLISKNTLKNRINICLKHLDRHIEYKGERVGITAFRKYYSGYFKGFHKAAEIRKKLVLLTEKKEIYDMLYSLVD